MELHLTYGHVLAALGAGGLIVIQLLKIMASNELLGPFVRWLGFVPKEKAFTERRKNDKEILDKIEKHIEDDRTNFSNLQKMVIDNGNMVANKLDTKFGEVHDRITEVNGDLKELKGRFDTYEKFAR